MSDTGLVRLGRTLAAYSVVAGLVGGGLYVALGQVAQLIDDWVLHNVAGGVSIGLLVWLFIGRQPRNGAVWALTLSAFFQSTNALALGAGLWQARRLGLPASLLGWAPGDLPTSLALIRQVDSWAWVPAVFLLLTFALLLFPDGRPPSPRWRWVGWWSAGAIVSMSAVMLWSARPSSTLPVVGGEIDFDVLPTAVAAATGGAFAALLAAIAFGLVALVVRFTRSSGVERQQFRWIAWGASPLALTMAMLVPAIAVPGFGFTPMKVTAALALPMFVGAYVVATARYRLYEIDRILSRTAAYAIVTATLAGTYVALVLGLRTLLAPFTDGSELAVAASTLAVVAVFRPVNARVRGFVDRRFNRTSFDARLAIEEFTHDLRGEVELDTVREGLAAVAASALQPAHVSVWLSPNDEGERSPR